MSMRKLGLAAAAAAILAGSGALETASADEQFFPMLVYRTGPYAPSGIPLADGMINYLELINKRDGGINGVTATWEECETEYNNDKGVECYERLKAKATVFSPYSTGITYGIIEKARADKIPVLSMGYGRADATIGSVFPHVFTLPVTYWAQADALVQYAKAQDGGSLKGKKIALVYHDSPYGKEPIPLLQARAKANGFDLQLFPVTAPGVQQKSTWLQIRQQRPDYVILWSAGIMTPTAIREAQAVGYPRDKMYGIWWAASENDVADLGDVAKGYNGITIHNSAEQGRVHQDLKTHVYDKGQGSDSTGKFVGTIAHTRGMIISMLQVEAIRTAQEKFGKGKHMTPEQVQWGFENLNIDQKRLDELGFGNLVRPVKTSCSNHMGDDWARIIQWDGKKFNVVSDWYQSDKSFVDPLVKELGEKYAQEKKLEIRNCAG